MRKGFNLVEAAIVLGVIGLVIGGIWVAASAVTRNQNLNAFMQEVTLIIEDIGNNFKHITTTRNSAAMHNYLMAKGFYPSTSTNDQRLGPNATVSWYWDKSSSQPAPLVIILGNIDKGYCQILGNRLQAYLVDGPHPTKNSAIMPKQTIIQQAITDCLNNGWLQLNLSAVATN